MSIEGQLYYRNTYLKSEKWQAVRLEALVREKALCQICAEESISNDAHHIWYPEKIWDTTEANLVILCRPCHDFLHLMLPECKTNNEQEGRDLWFKFSNAIIVWRRHKIALFKQWSWVLEENPKELRRELARLQVLLEERGTSKKPAIPESERESDFVFRTVKKWFRAFEHSAQSVKSSIADSDFEI